MSEHHGDGVTRREVLIGAAGGLALAAVRPAEAQTSPDGQVSGVVFEDKDGSGAPGPANPGLAGVLVGLVEAMTALVIDPSLKQVGIFAIYVLVLMFRPRGLFGRL